MKTGPKITLFNEKTIKDKIRMVVEALIFSWFVPGKKWRQRSE
jgi:hypothetical protein